MRIRIRPSRRAWLGEVGNIVLGVLIALGFGSVANDLSYGRDVDTARRAIEEELAKTIGQGLARQRISSCIERRLDTLSIVLEQAERADRLPPLGDINAAPSWGWFRGAWDSVDPATRGHFNREELESIAASYELIPMIRSANNEESALWIRLYSMVGPGRPITPDELVDLRNAIIAARAANRAIIYMAKQVKQIADTQHLSYSTLRADSYASRVTTVSPICQPINLSVPAHYGEAPYRNPRTPAHR